MFQEAIGELTAEHLRSHLAAYLTEIEAAFSGSNKLTMRVPTIDSSTLVGGVMAADVDQLPLIGVDCVDKSDIPSGESLYFYQYAGAIVGLVRSSDATSVDKLIKRYARAAEKFVREHNYLHEESNDDFMIREFLYLGTSFSGSMEVELEEERRVWIAGFTCNVIWITSEAGPSQH